MSFFQSEFSIQKKFGFLLMQEADKFQTCRSSMQSRKDSNLQIEHAKQKTNRTCKAEIDHGNPEIQINQIHIKLI